MSTKNYITPSGAAKIRAEIKHLLYEERPKIVEVVSWAAGNGDRSENGDYIYGKKRLREIDRRIGFLNRRLDGAEIVDPTAQTSERIVFGATVEVEDEEGAIKIYQIVGADESEPSTGRVSWTSPIAKALLGKRQGDDTTFRSPRGEQELVILSVKYIAIE
jgi:transcription elongation factor GreB